MALQIFGPTYKIDKKVLQDVSAGTFLFLGKDFEVSFKFVSPTKIQELNRIYRHKDQVADVLSFKLDDQEAGGDVVICLKEATRKAGEWQMTQSDVVCLLLVHGILHLAGYDHTNSSERAKMESAEAEILSKNGINIVK